MKLIIILLTLLLSACNLSSSENKNTSENSSPYTVTKNESPSPPPMPVITEETLGESYTILYDKSEARLNNIHLACGSIYETVLSPGGEFSFNEICGIRNEQKG